MQNQPFEISHLKCPPPPPPHTHTLEKILPTPLRVLELRRYRNEWKNVIFVGGG